MALRGPWTMDKLHADGVATMSLPQLKHPGYTITGWTAAEAGSGALPGSRPDRMGRNGGPSVRQVPGQARLAPWRMIVYYPFYISLYSNTVRIRRPAFLSVLSVSVSSATSYFSRIDRRTDYRRLHGLEK